MISRDYSSVKMWDLQMEMKPHAVTSIPIPKGPIGNVQL